MKKKEKKLLCSLSIEQISDKNINENFKDFKTNLKGLSFEEVRKRILIYGYNVLKEEKIFWLFQFFSILFSPFNIIFFFIIIFYFYRNIFFTSEKNETEYFTIFFITFYLFSSSIINFIQTIKFSRISEKLKQIIQNKSTVKRDSQILVIPSNEIVVGDIVFLSAGSIIPADIKIFESKNFLVKEASLTGENKFIKKNALSVKKYKNILEDKRIIFMGTHVVSGYAEGLVIATGNETYLGKINQNLIKKKLSSTLSKNVNSINRILILFIIFTLPLICIFYFCKNPSNFQIWEVFLFALTIVLGITPEMLPLIITTSFLTNIFSLSKKNVILKNLSSILDFGFMNILFTDKTGTLTEDKISVGHYLDLDYKNNNKVLEYAFYNSYFQTGIKNSIQTSIIQESKKIINNKEISEFAENKFQKISDIPFDFQSRIVSVILKDKQKKDLVIITQGAIEEILNICDYYTIPNSYNFLFNKYLTINKQKILKETRFYNKKGFRVVGIAYKKINHINNLNEYNTPNNMIMLGFLTFLDSPKKSAINSIATLKKSGVNVKILTGDNPVVSQIIASKVNLGNNQDYLLGEQIDEMTDDCVYKKALNSDIFSKLNPSQKERIVSLFKKKGNIVGFIGDGINDAYAMRSANCSISVDSGADITKESADIIFLEKDLQVLQNIIIEGRKTYINMLKYIQLTLASNFGNVLSILAALYFLPFLPFLPIQILFLNLIYDISCLFIPLDRVDKKYLQKPSIWNLKNIIHFIFLFGILSFIFDMLFFYLIYTKDMEPSDFQVKWFIFSIWTQIFNIFILRTDNIIKDAKISLRLLFLLIMSGFVSFLLPLIGFTQKLLHFPKNYPFFDNNYNYLVIFIIFLFFYIFCVIFAKNIFILKKKKIL